jgi:hypothetical protein
LPSVTASSDHPGMNRLVCLVWLATIGLACGSDDPASSPDARATFDAEVVDPTVLRVAGDYPTQVMLQSSTCAATNVMSRPTTVRHDPGATTLTLVHAGSVYPGSIQTDGDFMTTPVPQQVGADTHTLVIAGTFTTTGFTATVTVEVTRNASAVCTYIVGWTGTRASGANVIPG